MRRHRVHGRDADSLPAFESFRYRAVHMSVQELRLCDRCLRQGRRCSDSKRAGDGQNWKSFRRHRWSP